MLSYARSVEKRDVAKQQRKELNKKRKKVLSDGSMR